jgi:hypothetical protein
MFPSQHVRFVCSQCSKRAVNVFLHIQHVCTWDSGRQTCLHVVLIAAGAISCAQGAANIQRMCFVTPYMFAYCSHRTLCDMLVHSASNTQEMCFLDVRKVCTLFPSHIVRFACSQCIKHSRNVFFDVRKVCTLFPSHILRFDVHIVVESIRTNDFLTLHI